MLTLLKIRNLALVDQLLWEPSSGFICITGETGAGKSVIIGAIRLALGERADKTLIRSGEQQCSVEAVFHLPESSPVHGILNEHGVPPCEDGNLIIKRIISSTANRQFLNDSPCTLNLLREAGACLVDMHGPSDHRSLISQERQLSLLDAFGEHAPLLHAYADAWRQWQDARRAYDDLEHAEAATAREIELLRHHRMASSALSPVSRALMPFRLPLQPPTTVTDSMTPSSVSVTSVEREQTPLFLRVYVIVSPPGKFHVPRAARQARLRPARPAHTVIYCSTVSAALQRMDAQRECRCQIFVKCS